MKKSTLSPKKLFVAGLALSAAVGLGACGTTDNAADSSSAHVSTAAADTKLSRPEPLASLKAIGTGGSTAVKLDAGFVSALKSLNVTPGVDGKATLADGSASFPITGGTVTLFDKASGYKPWVQGTIFHQGSGITLTAGSTVISLENFVVDPGSPARLFGDVLVNGQLAAASQPLFDLNGRTLKDPDLTANPVVLTGTEVKLSPEAAALLGSTLKTDAITPGLLIGVATISVPTA